VGEDGGVAGDGAKLGDDPIGARLDLSDRLSFGDAVEPKRPARALLADVDRFPPLVGAVVPLHQLLPWLGDVAEPRQSAGVGGARERARQHQRELPPLQLGTDRSSLSTTALG
jgi:hypothetical protein